MPIGPNVSLEITKGVGKVVVQELHGILELVCWWAVIMLTTIYVVGTLWGNSCHWDGDGRVGWQVGALGGKARWLPGSGGRLKVLNWNLHWFQLLKIIQVLDSISRVRCASGNVFCLQGNEGLLSAKNHMKVLWLNWNHHPPLHNILIQHYRLKNAGEIFPCQNDLSLEGIELLNSVMWSFSLPLLPNILVTGTDLTCFYPCPALLIVKSDLPVWQPGAFCVHDMAALLIVDPYHYIWGLVAMVGGLFPWISNELGAWIEGLSCKSVQFWEWFSCLATHHIIPVLRRQRVG